MRKLGPLFALLCTSLCWGQVVVSASKIATPTYWTAVGVAAGLTAMDAGTTLTLIGPNRGCTVEGWSPGLYGRHPQAARVIPLMAGQVTAAALLAYEARRHRCSRRFWVIPLIAVGAHAHGAIHNLQVCR